MFHYSEGVSRSIIQSLIDTDVYKFYMLQVLWLKHRTATGTFQFKNRTKVPLAHSIDFGRLRAELEHIRSLRFSHDELAYLATIEVAGKRVFRDDFLDFLEGLQLAPIRVELTADEQNFLIESSGLLVEISLWETFVMSVVNRLYFLQEMRNTGLDETVAWNEGERRLRLKIETLKAFPELRFTDFGTRRRWSGAWQTHVLVTLLQKVPRSLIGTSNVLRAMQLGLTPVGTMAHEMDMAYQGIYFDEDDATGRLISHEMMMDDWQEVYEGRLTTALTDTYGSEYFIRTFSLERAKRWNGLRQDSGNPTVVANQFRAMYLRYGISGKEKTIVFSDGLNTNTMIGLLVDFAGLFRILFGWGTDLMNDMGFTALSIVMKLVECMGHETVKLSDNELKVTGSSEAVERVRRLAGHYQHESQALHS